MQWELHTTVYRLIRKKGDGVRNEETSNAYKAYVRKAKEHKQKAEFWREFEVGFYNSMLLLLLLLLLVVEVVVVVVAVVVVVVF